MFQIGCAWHVASVVSRAPNPWGIVSRCLPLSSVASRNSIFHVQRYGQEDATGDDGRKRETTGDHKTNGRRRETMEDNGRKRATTGENGHQRETTGDNGSQWEAM